ncbi:MAG: tetratricopeptide repeat protein [Pseudomonadota bacterium]
MADYETEEQQVEALKQWWADNWRAVLLGIGLGLALIFGWRGWQGHKLSVAQEASGAYTEVMQSLEANDEGADFLSRVAAMKEDHGGSSYAAMASLAEARFHVENNDLAEAEAALRWTIDKGTFAEIKSIARLRLARVLNAQSKHDEALAVLDKVTSQNYAGLVNEIRGDIHLDSGDAAEALAAYRRAQETGTVPAPSQNLQMKLDDLAVPETESTDDKS